MTFDASDRKAIRKAEKESAIADRSRAEIIFALMSSTPGRTYLWSELAATHVFHTSFALDPLQTAFSEGERNVGLRLLDSIMSHAGEEFLLMWRENRDREYSRQQRGSKDRDGGADRSDADDGDEAGGDDGDFGGGV